MAHLQESIPPNRNHTDRDDKLRLSDRPGATRFEIRVRGHLTGEWSDWFEGLELTLMDNGETVLAGPIVDQAALMGILNKLNGLNLTLLSIHQTKKE